MLNALVSHRLTGNFRELYWRDKYTQSMYDVVTNFETIISWRFFFKEKMLIWTKNEFLEKSLTLKVSNGKQDFVAARVIIQRGEKVLAMP